MATRLFQREILKFFILGLTITLTACGGKTGEKSSSSAITSSILVNSSTSSISSFPSNASSSSTASFVMGGAIQIDPLNIATVVSTFAGISPGANGIGSAARFYRPNAIARDDANLYITDTDNSTIRKIVIATGVVSTLAGTAGEIGRTDGIGAIARFDKPAGITSDGTNLYVTDTKNHTIRKIVIATGTVSTFAGTAGEIGNTDGIGIAARFSNPAGITTDGTSLYVADSFNFSIRKIVIATGSVSTLVDTVNPQTATSFYEPHGITTDGTNLYIADSRNHTIRKIVIATGATTILAGTAGVSGIADGTGMAASFSSPYGVTTDGNNLYVTDTFNATIRKIVISSGVVTTLAGTAGVSGISDGTGAAASFSSPYGVITDNTNLYVADTENNTIRKIVIATGTVTTIAGSASNIETAAFTTPYGITTDGTNLYVADTGVNAIRKIAIATGNITTVISDVDMLKHPYDITTDGTNLYIADTWNGSIRKITISSGIVTTLVDTTSAVNFYDPLGITTDGINLYVSDGYKHIIHKITIATGKVTILAGSGIFGNADGAGTAASFYEPHGITTDGINLYVADSRNHTIRKIVIATGVTTTLAGTAGVSGIADGTGAAASFYYPTGITSDGTNLYVTDNRNHTIRKIVIATGIVTTIAGSVGIIGSDNGVGTEASFAYPYGITTDGFDLFVTDSKNNTIRKIH